MASPISQNSHHIKQMSSIMSVSSRVSTPTFLEGQSTKAMGLALTSEYDKQTQDALAWYKSMKFGQRAFGNITFAGITQHVAKFALVDEDIKRRVNSRSLKLR